AVDALGGLGREAAGSVPALIKALRDPDELVRESAARALSYIEPVDSRTVVPALTESLSDKAAAVRVAGATTLCHVDRQGTQTVPVLIEALKNKEGRGDVQRSAAWALGLMGARAKEAIPALMELARDEDQGVRRAAETALRRIREKQAR